MSVSTTVVSTRNCLPSSRPSWTAPCLVVSLHGGRGEQVKGAVEGVVLGHTMAVDIGKAAQGRAVVDAFAQLAIVPVLDAHEDEGAQVLRGGDPVTSGVGVGGVVELLQHV